MSLSKGIQSAAAAALSAAMLIAVAACGTTDGTDTASKSGDSSKDSSSTSIQGFDTSNIQKDDEIAALLPDSVTSDGTLTVGTDTSYAPAEFLAEDGKTPVGFDVDLSKAIAAVFGLKGETISSTFDSIIPSVGSKYDLGISSFTVTKERMHPVDPHVRADVYVAALEPGGYVVLLGHAARRHEGVYHLVLLRRDPERYCLAAPAPFVVDDRPGHQGLLPWSSAAAMSDCLLGKRWA